MKHYLRPVFALAMLLLLTVISVQAATGEKMVIALKTDDFELAETDISELAVGEAQTIETESGTVIDILRTTGGADIYIDGELLEMNFDDEGLHEVHLMEKHVEIVCDDDEECSKHVIVLGGDDSHNSEWVKADGENVFIHKEVEITCTDDEDTTACSDRMIWISDDEDVDLEELHESHQSGEGHKVIVIKKEIVSED